MGSEKVRCQIVYCTGWIAAAEIWFATCRHREVARGGLSGRFTVFDASSWRRHLSSIASHSAAHTKNSWKAIGASYLVPLSSPSIDPRKTFSVFVTGSSRCMFSHTMRAIALADTEP